MTQFTDTLPDKLDQWEVVLRTPKVWAKIEHGTFGKRPISDHDLISWWKGKVSDTGETVNLVPSNALFFNQNRLSTQVPMKHVYYTNSKDMTLINGALRNVSIKFSEEWYAIRSLQDMIGRLQKGEDPYLED